MKKHRYETGLNELFSVCIFLRGVIVIGEKLIGSYTRAHGGSAIFWAIAELLQQGQLCLDVCSCRLREYMCVGKSVFA